MPCRHAAGDRSDGGIDDGNFRRSALAIGGRRALATLLEREGSPDLDPEPVPDARGSQYAWSVPTGSGCPVDHGDGDTGSGDGSGDRGSPDGSPSPRYHLLVSLEYEGEVPDDDRRNVEAALAALEGTFGWGPDGVAFALGYSRRYFDRFDAPLPDGVAAALAEDPRIAADGGDDPPADGPDALLHLASDDARILLAAERTLWGEDPVIDRSLSATFEGVFARPGEPPARRAAVAAGEDAVPDPDAAIEAGTDADGDDGEFAGGAVLRVDARSPATGSTVSEGPSTATDGTSTPSGTAAGCPAHGDGSEADADRQTEGGDLLGLAPSDPVAVDLELSGPAADGPDRAGGGRRFLVPPVADRALPSPRPDR